MLRRDVGGFVKPSGISFQFDMLVALDGGGIEGDWVYPRGGGGIALGWGVL